MSRSPGRGPNAHAPGSHPRPARGRSLQRVVRTERGRRSDGQAPVAPQGTAFILLLPRFGYAIV